MILRSVAEKRHVVYPTGGLATRPIIICTRTYVSVVTVVEILM